MELELTVNQKLYHLDVDPSDSLLQILRDQLNLTGTKNGCNQGHCGACTVVVNGKAVKSCLIRAKKLEKAKVVTIEGISDDFELHSIQKAFIEIAAVQCGFCSPGYIMELYALFSTNINATEADIREVLEGHLCRCTGYKPILDAAFLAQKMIKSKS
jgi:carbon-monoxide dehydrogenase small subunit